MTDQTDNTALSTDVQAQLNALREGIKKTVATPKGQNVSIKGKMFTMPDGESHPGPFRCVVLDYANFYSYYESAYDPNDIQPPVCWALGRELDELSPSDNAPKMQHGNCKQCPMNQFKSAPNGRGKACRNSVRLVLSRPNPKADDPIMTMHVNPKAIGGWGNYVRRVDSEFKMPPVGVITNIAFNPNEVYPSLVFEEPETNPDIEVCLQLRARAQDILFAEPEVNLSDDKMRA